MTRVSVASLRVSRVTLKLVLRGGVLVAGVGLVACHRQATAREQQASAAASAQPTHVAARVEISERGFEPQHVLVEDAQPLVFRRTTDHGCATALVFPQFGIEEPLPLNTDVSIVLPPTASGEVAFQCGVGENRGKVVANVEGS
ncbi:MAG: cupredoxin domain-containing protein [Polyangiaceae bacterium]